MAAAMRMARFAGRSDWSKYLRSKVKLPIELRERHAEGKTDIPKLIAMGVVKRPKKGK